MNRGTQLIKNSVIIMLGKFATQFVSFILLPLYTSLLTTAEYGMVDFFTTYVQLFLPLATLLVEQGAFRYLLEYSDNLCNKKKVVTSSLSLIIILATIYLILFVFISPFIKNDYKFYVLAMLVVSAFSSWGLQIARGLKNMSVYAEGSFITTAVAVVFNVLFIAFFKTGVVGMLWATIISNVACCLYVCFKLRLHEYCEWKSNNKVVLMDMLKYSLPLIPNQLSLWIINFSDRGIVNIFLGTAANGILAISHKFSSIYSTIFGMFQLSWHEMGVMHFNDDDRDEFFTDMFAQVYRFFSSMCIGLIAVIPFIFPVLIKDNFQEAYATIPIYFVAVLCNITVGLLGVVYVALKKTREIAKSTIYSCIINVILHILLVKKIGLYAAAISTLVSYLCVMLYRMVDTRKYIKIKYEYGIYVLSLVIIGIVTLAYYSENMSVYVLAFGIALIYAVAVNMRLLKMVVCYIRDKLEHN